MDNLLGLGGDNFDQANAGVLPRFSKVDIDTTVALVNQEFDTSGFNFMWVAPDPYVRTAGGGFDPTLIDPVASVGRAHAQFGDTVAPAVPLKRGFVYSLPATRILYVTAPAQAATMMRLYFSTGPRVLPFSADVSLSGGVSPLGGVLNDMADVAVPNAAATIVLAASATTRTALITNPSASAVIRVGSLNVGAARGTIVQPGGVAALDTQSAVYVYQASGGALNIPVAWITNP